MLEILFKMSKLNKSSIFFFLILYLTLIIGFYYGEDSTGGAYFDYLSQKEIAKKFSFNFINTFLTYDDNYHRHSPILSIYLSIFEKLNLDDSMIRFINLQIAPICLLLFFLTLKIKFKNVNENYLFIFSMIFFLSPTIRSLAIWPDSRLFGLTLFLLSIYYYLLFIEQKKLKFAILNTFSLAACSYLSPNFSIFSILFLANYLNYYRISKNILLILFINIILATPAIYYIFILDVNFLKIAAIAYNYPLQNLNIANKILLISTIFFFYFIPFFLIYEKKLFFIKEIFKIKNIFLSIFLCLICIYFFSYDRNFYGGGIFFHLSNKLFDNNIALYLIFFLSILLIIKILSFSQYNLLIFTLLILSNPQLSIFHKYYDPLIWILVIFFFELGGDKQNIFKPKIIFSFYFFSLIFLVLSLFK